MNALLANSAEVQPNVWELLDELKVDQPTLINYLLAKRRKPVDRAFMQDVKAWGEKQARRSHKPE